MYYLVLQTCYPSDQKTEISGIMWYTFQFNSIVFAYVLITGTVSKGLTGHVFMTAPKGQERTPLVSKEDILRRNAEWCIPPSRDGQECNGCHNCHIHTYIHAYTYVHTYRKKNILNRSWGVSRWTIRRPTNIDELVTPYLPAIYLYSCDCFWFVANNFWKVFNFLFISRLDRFEFHDEKLYSVNHPGYPVNPPWSPSRGSTLTHSCMLPSIVNCHYHHYHHHHHLLNGLTIIHTCNVLTTFSHRRNPLPAAR